MGKPRFPSLLTPLDAMRAVVQRALLEVSGVRVGLVLSYDPVQRVADVQPVRRRILLGKATALPVISQAPVGWWRFGRMVLAGELEPGDEVLLVTCDREIRPWWISGAEHDPSSERMHDPTDTIVLPWISSLVRPITARGLRSFFMGREDGTAGITIPMDVPARIVIDAGPAGVVLGSAAVQPALLGTSANTAINAYAAAITAANSALNGVAQTFWNLPTQPNPTAPEIATYAAGWAAWNTATAAAQAALATALTAALAIKVVVE